ncbi:hypothetical protein B0H13DRAFT_2669834 [Mycena leptocephala]|nr:hypothetical protein B0H13DRAFT_2669834 [Mycena leptocephala]
MGTCGGHSSWDSTAFVFLPSTASLLLASSPAAPPPYRMRRFHSTRITSDTFAATKVALKAIQASTDACAPLKSGVSTAIVLLEMSEKVKSNKKGCEHVAKRSAKLVQDIWTQTNDIRAALPAEVLESVSEIEKLFKEIKTFFEGLQRENIWERFARQDCNKSQVEEYGRLLDEAMWHFTVNLELSLHRLHLESAAADAQRHVAVLAVSQMGETERMQLLTEIHAGIHMGKCADGLDFFLVHVGNTFTSEGRR